MALRIGAPPVRAGMRVFWRARRIDYEKWLQTTRYALARRASSATRQWRMARQSASAALFPKGSGHSRLISQYSRFAERYEHLVELLCCAAKECDHSDIDVRYARIRQWMQRNYHTVRPHLRLYLEPWEGPLDPFEELFAAECIDEVINDCNAISNCQSSRRALEACRSDLDSVDADG